MTKTTTKKVLKKKVTQSNDKVTKKTVLPKKTVKTTKKTTKKVAKSKVEVVKAVVVPKKKGGPIDKQKKADIMKTLTGLVLSGATLGATQTQLARQLDVNRETAVKYLKEIYNSIPPEDIEHTRVKLQTMFDRLFREAQDMMNTAKSPTAKKEAGEFMLKCFDKFQDFLERFGIKQKAVERFEGKFEHLQLSINMDLPEYEQIKELESRRENV